MKIEFIKFYPIQNGKILKGSLHVQLPDFGINLRGIFVSRDNKGRYFFGLPKRAGRDEAGNEVNIQIFSFLDKEKNRDLINCLRTHGEVFIEAWLTNPPQEPESSKTDPRSPSVVKMTSTQKEVLPLKKEIKQSKPNPFAGKTFIDPPKRTSGRRSCTYGK